MINIKKSLFSIVAIVFLFQIIKYYSFYVEHSDWQYADWIINYQGGFIRRGLVGELLFRIHQITRIDLDFIVLSFVSSVVFFISYFLIRSIKYINESRINTLIFLSPGFFLYPMMNSAVVGQKDILIIFAMGFFVFFGKKFESRNLFLLLIFFIFFLTLSHSGFLFYIPYLLFLYFLIKINRNDKTRTFEVATIIISLILIIILIIFNQGTENQVKEICDSVKKFVSDRCGIFGQTYWLTNDYKDYLSEKAEIGINYSKYLTIYLISLILVYFFLIIKIIKSKFNINYFFLNKINPLFIFFFLFLFTLPTYIFGLDWGRYIFISYSCSFFILIYCVKENLISSNFDLKLTKFTFITVIIFYSFLWTFPFYNAENFKFTLKKPVLSLIKKF